MFGFWNICFSGDWVKGSVVMVDYKMFVLVIDWDLFLLYVYFNG